MLRHSKLPRWGTLALLLLLARGATGQAQTIVDNRDAAFGVTGTGWTESSGDPFGFAGTTHYTAGGTGSHVATWTFTGLTAGQYRVSATWVADPGWASNAPYRINGGAAIPVNQQQVPNDFTDRGVGWKNLATAFTVSGTTLTVTLTDAANGYVFADAIRIERVTGSGVTEADAIRFLEQASWGPNNASINHVRAIGFEAWINEQFNAPASSYPTLPLVNPTSSVGCPAGSAPTCVRDNYTMYLLQNQFFLNGMYQPDQLRQRVAFALHKIWVVSSREVTLPSAMSPYLQVFDRNAFGNFRTLMTEMTLNAAMGEFLDMANSRRTNPNENYPREILQLFTVGLDELNLDGTPRLDTEGNRIPTYDQNQIIQFSKVFTGWTYAPLPAGAPAGSRNWIAPMVLGGANPENPANHDFTAKGPLFNGLTIPARTQSVANAYLDLNNALDNIFNHPNVGPFIGKQLIQMLVTSNPSPAYVSRVATTFNNNGQGVRGDMRAVIRAVLLDPEARGSVQSGPTYGKLREPIQYQMNLLRAFNARSFDGTTQSDGAVSPTAAAQGQTFPSPPSVFSYFPPDRTIPGSSTILGPEFGILNSTTAFAKANFINTMVNPNSTAVNVGITVASPDRPNGTSLDLSGLVTLSQADSTGGQLVDELNRLLLHGTMSSQSRTTIMQAVQAVSGTNHTKRARTALYLVLTASQYQVQR